MAKRVQRRTDPVLRDHVDRLVDGWAAERPDLDTTGMSIVYRVTRIAAVWSAEIDRLFSAHGMTSTDFAVLANLRRAGAPYRLNQRDIMTALRLTSGTVSLRIEKMVDRGLVTRAPDPADARASIVTLTDAGAALFDRVAPQHLANETRMVASLSEGEREQLARLLRTVLVEIEQPADDRPDRRLGFVATPAVVAQQKRAELGLPSQHGILVGSVANGGPADRAGLRPGDTVVELDGTRLHSLTGLDDALARAPRRVGVTVVRNGATLRVEVDRSAG